MKEATHIQRRLLDHFYIRHKELSTSIYRYSPYYTDHDALCTTHNNITFYGSGNINLQYGFQDPLNNGQWSVPCKSQEGKLMKIVSETTCLYI